MEKNLETYRTYKISKRDISKIKQIIQTVKSSYGKSKYFVEFDGEIYPLKKFFYAILKVYNKDIKTNNINTSFALNFIKKLGLRILTKQEAMLKFASVVEIGGTLLRKKKKSILIDTNVLVAIIDKKKAIERYENFLTIVSPKINHSEVVNNLKINPSLNYNDWLLLLYALKHKIEILSFDKALIEEYKKYSINEGRS